MVFAGPSVISFFLVVMLPLVYGVYLTFTGWDGISNAKPFVGFQNYFNLLSDITFWKSLWITVKYVAISVVLINVIAFLLAYFNRRN